MASKQCDEEEKPNLQYTPLYSRIVEERADATNVNNWHWTEKNATLWSKDKLRELLIGLTIENDECNFCFLFKRIIEIVVVK